jgi:hypothetical protein
MFKNAKIVGSGINPDQYHQPTGERGTPEFVVSSSSLRSFASCPSKWRNGWELPASDSLAYGSLFDVLVLTPEQFASRYVVIPATYESKAMACPKCKSVSDSAKCRNCKCDREETTVSKPWNANSDTCREWFDEQRKSGRGIVSAQDLKDAQAAASRLAQDAQLSNFIASCDKQVWVTAEWHDEDTGIVVMVKCLLDLAGRSGSAFEKSLGDLKTTKNAAPIPWAKWAHFAGYEVQAAWNTDLFVAATGREIVNFCFVLSENSHPWEVGRRFMSQDLLEPGMDTGDIASGRRQYLAMLKGYCQCLKRGFWPSYDDTDESSADGWTLIQPNPFDEQRRMFAPKFNFAPQETPHPDSLPPEDEDPDLIP